MRFIYTFWMQLIWIWWMSRCIRMMASVCVLDEEWGLYTLTAANNKNAKNNTNNYFSWTKSTKTVIYFKIKDNQFEWWRYVHIQNYECAYSRSRAVLMIILIKAIWCTERHKRSIYLVLVLKTLNGSMSILLPAMGLPRIKLAEVWVEKRVEYL